MKPPRRFTFSQCFEILGLDRPKISGKSQGEVNQKLAEWKDTELKSAYRAKAKETHPDISAASDEEAEQAFKDVRDAYDQLRVDLKIHLRPPKPKERTPEDDPATKCPGCGSDRIPAKAKFCHECGHPYGMDALEHRLLQRGITAQTLWFIKTNGDYARMKAMSPLSDTLKTEIELLWQRQRLGLIGTHSPWGGGRIF